MATSNAMIQLARMYTLIEAALREAATKGQPLSIPELNNRPEIKELTKSSFQTRDVVNRLVGMGHVIRSNRSKGLLEFIWDVNSSPFIIGKRNEQKAARLPSKVENHEPVAQEQQAVEMVRSKDIEIQMGSITLVVGLNPINGRVRITIED